LTKNAGIRVIREQSNRKMVTKNGNRRIGDTGTAMKTIFMVTEEVVEFPMMVMVKFVLTKAMSLPDGK
jgi:hypothetical protein